MRPVLLVLTAMLLASCPKKHRYVVIRPAPVDGRVFPYSGEREDESGPYEEYWETHDNRRKLEVETPADTLIQGPDGRWHVVFVPAVGWPAVSIGHSEDGESWSDAETCPATTNVEGAGACSNPDLAWIEERGVFRLRWWTVVEGELRRFETTTPDFEVWSEAERAPAP